MKKTFYILYTLTFACVAPSVHAEDTKKIETLDEKIEKAPTEGDLLERNQLDRDAKIKAETEEKIRFIK